MACGVPLVPSLVLFCDDLQLIMESHILCPHLYADDSQLYGTCRPSAIPELQTRISACTDDVARWMRSNRLQLNSSKTEIPWLATSRRLHQLLWTLVRISADLVVPFTIVRDLGILIDSDVSNAVPRSVSTWSCVRSVQFAVQCPDP